MARQLRAVDSAGPDPSPPASPEPAKTVLAAATGGKRIELLEALQTVIARKIDDPKTPGRDLAALVNRQLEIARDIETLRAADPPKTTNGSSEPVADSYNPAAI